MISSVSTFCAPDDSDCEDAVARSEKAKVIHITHFQCVPKNIKSSKYPMTHPRT